jgi:hypothetical protein
MQTARRDSVVKAALLLTGIFLFLNIAAPAKAYFYNVNTYCGTGLGANGTIIQCEPAPLLVPPDCSFINSTYGKDDRIEIAPEVAFVGTCAGDTQYIQTFIPDTTQVALVGVPCDYNPWAHSYYSPQLSILSGYSRCIPSTQISCAMYVDHYVGCWRNSTDLMVNGGFETSYTTAIPASGENPLSGAPNNTYVPDWSLPYAGVGYPYHSYLSNDDWWGKTGNNYMNVTSSCDGCVTCGLMSLVQAVYIPPDLGSLYNISYNLSASISLSGFPTCTPYVTTYLDFPDNTTFNLQNFDYTSPFNGTFSQTVNIGNKTGNAHIHFETSCESLYWGNCYYLNEFKLDDVHIVSECVGTSANCTEELTVPPNATTTTTTTTTLPSSTTTTVVGSTTTTVIGEGLPPVGGLVYGDPLGSETTDAIAQSTSGIKSFLFEFAPAYWLILIVAFFAIFIVSVFALTKRQR